MSHRLLMASGQEASIDSESETDSEDSADIECPKVQSCCGADAECPNVPQCSGDWQFCLFMCLLGLGVAFALLWISSFHASSLLGCPLHNLKDWCLCVSPLPRNITHILIIVLRSVGTLTSAVLVLYRAMRAVWGRMRMYFMQRTQPSFADTLEDSWKVLAGHRMGEPLEAIEKCDFLTGWSKISILTQEIVATYKAETPADDLAVKIFVEIDADGDGLISKNEFKSWCWGKFKEERPCRLLLVGSPGAGKSTMINKLLGRDEAVAGENARGTTKTVTVYDVRIR